MKAFKLFALLLTLLILYACPDKVDEVANADYKYDALENTYNMDLEKGTNILLESESRRIALNLKIEEGKKPEYTITENGVEIPSNLIEQKSSGKTTCWRCARDGKGDLHCFIIECPKDLKPIGTVNTGKFKLSRAQIN